MIQPTISLPPLDEVARHWHEAEPIIRRATDRSGSYEPIDLLALASQGRVGIWFAHLDNELVGVAVTEITQFPRDRVLQVLFCAGRFIRAWGRPMMEAFKMHAKDAKCVSIQTLGRKGWVRAVGFVEIGSWLECRIN